MDFCLKFLIYDSLIKKCERSLLSHTLFSFSRLRLFAKREYLRRGVPHHLSFSFHFISFHPRGRFGPPVRMATFGVFVAVVRFAQLPPGGIDAVVSFRSFG